MSPTVFELLRSNKSKKQVPVAGSKRSKRGRAGDERRQKPVRKTETGGCGNSEAELAPDAKAAGLSDLPVPMKTISPEVFQSPARLREMNLFLDLNLRYWEDGTGSDLWQDSLSLSGHIRARSIWREFTLQQQAFEFLDSQASARQLRVFAEEYSTDGKRRFIVTTPLQFWGEYQNMLTKHHYEIIREGTPCHAYFDLEFSVSANPGISGSQLVELLVHVVDQVLQHQFDLPPLQPHWVLELDSSTEVKFSRHLVVRIPGTLLGIR